jgi:hypothetical protein
MVTPVPARHATVKRPRVGERIQPAPADQLADLAVHDVQGSRHGMPALPRTVDSKREL